MRSCPQIRADSVKFPSAKIAICGRDCNIENLKIDDFWTDSLILFNFSQFIHLMFSSLNENETIPRIRSNLTFGPSKNYMNFKTESDAMSLYSTVFDSWCHLLPMVKSIIFSFIFKSKQKIYCMVIFNLLVTKY